MFHSIENESFWFYFSRGVKFQWKKNCSSVIKLKVLTYENINMNKDKKEKCDNKQVTSFFIKECGKKRK